jgi:hypothetical protein
VEKVWVERKWGKPLQKSDFFLYYDNIEHACAVVRQVAASRKLFKNFYLKKVPKNLHNPKIVRTFASVGSEIIRKVRNSPKEPTSLPYD